MAPPFNAANSLDQAILYDSIDLSELKGDEILAKKVYKAIWSEDFPIGYNFFFNRYADLFHVGFRKGLYVDKKNIPLIVKDILSLKYKSDHWPSPQDYAQETNRDTSTINDLIKKGYLGTELVYAVTQNHKIRWSHRFEPSQYNTLIEEYKERQQFIEENIGDEKLAELTGFSQNQIEYFLRMGFISGTKYFTSETQREGGRGTKICFSKKEVERIHSIVDGLNYENLLQSLRDHKIEITHHNLIQTIEELGLEDQYLPINKKENNYQFSRNLAEAIVTHYHKLGNKKIFYELPSKELFVGGVPISGTLKTIIEEEEENNNNNNNNNNNDDKDKDNSRINKTKNRIRRRKCEGNNSESRHMIMKEILEIPFLTSEEEMKLGERIAGLERKILSHLYTSHKEVVDEYYESLEHQISTGPQEKQALGRRYRAIIRNTHDEFFSEGGERNIQDLLWDLYSHKRDASYIKDMLKLIDQDDDIKKEVNEWQNCLHDLIMGNMSPSFQASKKYTHVNGFIKWDDHFQESFFGQIRASETWDYTLGYKFKTHCHNWVKSKIRRNINNNGYTIRVPVYLRERLHTIKKHTSINLSNAEVMKEMELNDDQIKHVNLAEEVQYEVKSLNIKVGENWDSEIIDHVADEKNQNPQSLTEDNLRDQQILKALEGLSKREAKILRMRFGILEDKDHTLEEIGNMMGVTRERIRQIEAIALKKLRNNPTTMAILREFY